MHTTASVIKHQKRSTARTARLQPSFFKSPVNSSGTGLNIKILPLLTKFRTRDLRIMNSRSHKHSIIGSRRESWSPRPWSVSDVVTSLGMRYFAINRLTWLWFIPMCLAMASLCLASHPHTDYAPKVLVLQGMMHHDVF